MKTKVRDVIEKKLLGLNCWATDIFESTHPHANQYHRAKIMSGPLQGKTISMAQLEKFSYVLGRYERHVANCMAQYISEGDTVFDIGSNIGYFSLLASKFVGQQGKVFAFEADPENFAVLQENINQNGLSNTQTINQAVSDTSGEVVFASFDYSLVGHIANSLTPSDATLFTVPSISLDDFVYYQRCPVPQFIKIDVEGAEDKVILGAQRLIAEHKPVIVAEIREGIISEAITTFLDAQEYRTTPLTRLSQNGFNYGEVLFVPQ